MVINDTLFIIPARGGSKGLPRKNILPINGKPMICYTIDAARGVTHDAHICVSTDDLEIKQVVEDYGLPLPFLRPIELATDTAGTREVLLHAVDFYQNELNLQFSKICLLQPTSPLRTSQHINEANQLWNNDLDMVVSVKHSHAASVLCHEDENGFLGLTLNKSVKRRQDFENFYEYNGAIYVINVVSLKEKGISDFTHIRKYVMDELNSVDIDSEIDWKLAEIIVKERHL